eukprot:COSAG02_NODE_17605_length_992_cov_0.881299_1_plen_64_part_00
MQARRREQSPERAQPPYSLAYSASNARTKARARKVDAVTSEEVYGAKAARALSHVEWWCVLLK